MKKTLISLLIISMLAAMPTAAFAAPAVSAQSSAAVTDSDAMAKALTAVKAKVDIPEDMTEFRGGANSYYDDMPEYEFSWNDKDNKKDLLIEADGIGRLKSLQFYVNDDYYDSSKKLSSMTREEKQRIAEEYISKLLPEAVSDANDCLVFDKLSSSDYDSISAGFKRIRNGVEVEDNDAHISLAYGDGELKYMFMSVSYDYDAVFEDEAQEISSPEDAYRAVFPEEMVYAKQYDYSAKRYVANGGPSEEIKLIYQIRDGGYVSAYTGETVEKDLDDMIVYSRNEAAMDSSTTKSIGGGLSPQEIAELDTIADLYTSEEAEKLLRSLSELAIPETSVLEGAHLSHYKDNSNDKYTLRLSLDDNESHKRTSAAFDAVHKRLTHISTYDYNTGRSYDDITSDSEQSSALIDSFLDKVIKDKLPEFELIKEDTGATTVRNYRRIVNGIPYVNNTIRAAAAYDTVIGYDLEYDDDIEFISPKKALDSDSAYAKLLEASPLQKTYIRTEDGYRLVYSRGRGVSVDAFTSEPLSKNTDYSAVEVNYDDIADHWCADAVTALRDNGIALRGTSFEPDTPVTQEDILRLFAAGMEGKYMLTTDTENLYGNCISSGILKKDERSETSPVTREQAFIYMVRFAGFDQVAKLSDIYKITYADGDKLTNGNIGYAAILSGMGIVEGDGGTLRPQDDITRAEAAMMLYRFMKY